MRRLFALTLATSITLPATAFAQSATAPPARHPALTQGSWQACTALPGDARLACFDRWAQQQHPTPPSPTARPTPSMPPAPSALTVDTAIAAPAAAGTIDETDTTRGDGCRDRRFSTLSRFWELEKGSDCSTFGIRGYRPISLSWIASDSVNDAPSSPSAGHTGTPVPYQRYETRIQLSVRTKIAQGMLTPKSSELHDSLWFGYTQQSYWQLFNGAISRPFRTTDHEPEVVYVYPTTADLPLGWRLRYSGLGLVHQSNGQTLPLSRSWNRIYLMAGVENEANWRITGRLWQRLPEKTNDDNPDIADRIGRGELQASWDVNPRNTLAATVRSAFATSASGSVRLEWLRTIGDPKTSGLRFHTQLFSGYGDSLADYNRRRVVLSVGLSLVDF